MSAPKVTCDQHGTVHHHPAGKSCCRRCGAYWSGYRACHCPTCHNTFGGVTGFDLHRMGGDCRPLENVDLTWNPERGMWTGTYGGVA